MCCLLLDIGLFILQFLSVNVIICRLPLTYIVCIILANDEKLILVSLRINIDHTIARYTSGTLVSYILMDGRHANVILL